MTTYFIYSSRHPERTESWLHFCWLRWQFLRTSFLSTTHKSDSLQILLQHLIKLHKRRRESLLRLTTFLIEQTLSLFVSVTYIEKNCAFKVTTKGSGVKKKSFVLLRVHYVQRNEKWEKNGEWWCDVTNRCKCEVINIKVNVRSFFLLLVVMHEWKTHV